MRTSATARAPRPARRGRPIIWLGVCDASRHRSSPNQGANTITPKLCVCNIFSASASAAARAPRPARRGRPITRLGVCHSSNPRSSSNQGANTIPAVLGQPRFYERAVSHPSSLGGCPLGQGTPQGTPQGTLHSTPWARVPPKVPPRVPSTVPLIDQPPAPPPGGTYQVPLIEGTIESRGGHPKGMPQIGSFPGGGAFKGYF